MNTCFFCSSELFPANDSTRFPACLNCNPSPLFVTENNIIWHVHFRLLNNDIKYLISQEISSNIIHIYEIFDVIIEYEDSVETKEFYNTSRFIKIHEHLTPQNVQSILDKVLSMKAFL